MLKLNIIWQILKSFASLGPPNDDSEEECSIMHGLTSAVQCLSEVLPQNSKNNQANRKNTGDGRIICITNLKRLVKRWRSSLRL